MGTCGRDLALGLRSDFNLKGCVSDDDLERLCAMLDVEVLSLRLPCGREFIVDRLVVVEARLDRIWRRWLMAHALGHVLLHCGNQFRMASVDVARQERQADDFAGWLLCSGVYTACACEGDPAPLWQLAEDADVPPSCASAWVLSARRELCALRKCRMQDGWAVPLWDVGAG